MDAMGFHRRTFMVQSGLAGLAWAAGKAPVKNWVWIPTDLKRSPDEWKQRFDLMRASGVRAILPEVYAGR